jgi:hypothetical protein
MSFDILSFTKKVNAFCVNFADDDDVGTENIIIVRKCIQIAKLPPFYILLIINNALFFFFFGKWLALKPTSIFILSHFSPNF